MYIPLNTIMESEVVQIFRKRKLEIEELLLSDYERPLWKAPKGPKIEWTPTAIVAFATEMLHSVLP